MTSVGVNDPKVPTATCPVTTLAPGASTTCTGSLTLTQGDIDSGAVYNTATAIGTGPTGTWSPTATDSNATPLTPGRSLSLDKQGGTPTGTIVGSTIPYSFLITNTGNVTLNGIWLADTRLTSTSCPTTTLAVGASTTCTGTYTITQADVDAGSVVNSATATGYAQGTGLLTSATDGVTTLINRTATLTMDKQSGTPTGSAAGSTVAYTFIVKNTGNVTLTSVAVTDDKVGTVTCPTTTLVPNASTTCTASYTLAQADVDSGHVPNTATVTGTPPLGLVPPTASDSVDLPLAQTAALTLDKQAGTPSGNNVGSSIPYSFVVVNTGNVTVNALNILDTKLGAVSCPVTTLAPGATTTCIGIYPLTQADIDAGVVNNTATATADAPAGVTSPTATDNTTTSLTRTPSITLDKQGATPSSNTVGGTVDYTFVVKNTGNVTLTSVGVTDPNVDPVTCPVAILAPMRPRPAPRPTRSPRRMWTPDPWSTRPARRVPRRRVPPSPRPTR